MSTFLRNAISKLYSVVSAPVEATRDALAERLQGVRETASLLYNRMMKNMGYGRERLKDIVEKNVEEVKGQQQEEKAPSAAKEQKQDDDKVPEVNLVHEGRRVKEFQVAGNLNTPNTKMIMDNITQK